MDGHIRHVMLQCLLKRTNPYECMSFPHDQTLWDEWVAAGWVEPQPWIWGDADPPFRRDAPDWWATRYRLTDKGRRDIRSALLDGTTELYVPHISEYDKLLQGDLTMGLVPQENGLAPSWKPCEQGAIAAKVVDIQHRLDFTKTRPGTTIYVDADGWPVVLEV